VTLLDWRVLALTGGILLILTLLVSLAPILGLKRLGIASASRGVAARASLAQRLAGTAQIAVAGLLGGAAIGFAWYLGPQLFGRGDFELQNRYLVQAFPQRNTGSAEARVLESARWRDAVAALPGVAAVAFGSPVPAAEGNPAPIRIPDPGNSGNELSFYAGSLDADFVDVLGLELIFGRAPAETETDVVVVNRSLARLLFDRDNVVGERMPDGSVRGEIVGVLQDLSFGHPLATVRPYVFRPANNSTVATGVIESQLPAADLRQAIAGLNASEFAYVIADLRPLSQLRTEQIAPDRARGLLTIVTALLVVLLAAIGFYGTQRYLVAAGRREYAIRASLGAGPDAIGRLVLRRGLLLGLPGLALGAVLAFLVVAWLRDDYVARSVPPGGVAALTVALLTGLLLAASLGPARAARRTQPAPLLRED
jgi:hypothetical protein